MEFEKKKIAKYTLLAVLYFAALRLIGAVLYRTFHFRKKKK